MTNYEFNYNYKLYSILFPYYIVQQRKFNITILDNDNRNWTTEIEFVEEQNQKELMTLNAV